MATESPRQGSSVVQIYLSNPWNLIQSAFLILTWIVMGAHLELVGPTMSILAENANVDYSGMGSALASRGFGYLIANLFGAVAEKIVVNHSEALLTVAFVFPSIVVFATPFVRSLILMCVLFLIQGISQGLTDLGGTNVLLKMWGVHAAAPLSSAHLGYGIGAVFVNLIVRPFLTQSSLSTNTTQSVHSLDQARSNIEIPYGIVSIMCFLVAIGHLFFYVRKRRNFKETLAIGQVDYSAVNTTEQTTAEEKKKKNASRYSPLICGRGNFQYGLILSSIFIFYTFFIGGNDQTFSKFFFTYLKSDRFQISTGAASWAIILYWLSYSIGRLIFAIISVYVPVNICLNIVWFGGLCLVICWFIFVWIIGLTVTSLFILGALTGLIFSPIFPLSFALINQQLNVIPILLALLLAGSAIGSIVFQKIAGFVMDQNPNHFPTLLIVCLLASILLYVASSIIGYAHQRKLASNIRGPATQDTNALPSSTVNDEEQEMANYLADEENKTDTH